MFFFFSFSFFPLYQDLKVSLFFFFSISFLLNSNLTFYFSHLLKEKKKQKKQKNHVKFFFFFRIKDHVNLDFKNDLELKKKKKSPYSYPIIPCIFFFF